MATSNQNLSANKSLLQNLEGEGIAIVVSEWNEEITSSLFQGAFQTLHDAGLPKEKIRKIMVPGSYELPLAAQWVLEKTNFQAVICLGCVIRGETAHFDYICQAVAQGIKDVNLKFSKPVIFGVLTTENHQQALDRAGGKHGNKGDEAAYTAISLLNLHSNL